MIDREHYDPSFDMEEFVSVPARHTVIVRRAGNELEAAQIAQAMEDVGANVFSITYNVSRFLVWAKLGQHISVNQVDQAINERLT